MFAFNLPLFKLPDNYLFCGWCTKYDQGGGGKKRKTEALIKFIIVGGIVACWSVFFLLSGKSKVQMFGDLMALTVLALCLNSSACIVYDFYQMFAVVFVEC